MGEVGFERKKKAAKLGKEKKRPLDTNKDGQEESGENKYTKGLKKKKGGGLANSFRKQVRKKVTYLNGGGKDEAESVTSKKN